MPSPMSQQRRTKAAMQRQQDGKKERFLEAFAAVGTLTGACRVAGVSPHTVYAWEENDPTFSGRQAEAQSHVADRLEEMALARALNAGDPHGHLMIIFLLKALRPDKYRERIKVDVEHLVKQAALAGGLDADAADAAAREAERIVKALP